ncbi:MAG: hypothetical protein AAGN46_11965 [Acidobacteriota bacterium]
MPASQDDAVVDAASSGEGSALDLIRDSTWVQILLFVAVYRFLARFYFPLSRRPFEAYETASPFADFFASVGGWFLVLAPILLFASFWRRLSWQAIDGRCRTRILMMIPAGVLTWSIATMPYNYFFDQAYLWDRLILVGLLVAAWRHPLFMAPLLLANLAFGTQVELPMVDGTWTWVDKDLPIDAVILFVAYLVVRVLVGRPRPWLFAFGILCLTGGLYWNAALSKMSLGPTPWTWLLETEISNLLIHTYLGIDFLGFLSLETIEWLGAFLGRFDVLMGLGTLLIEASGLVIVVRRRLTVAVLIAFVALHIGIVAASGIFFWKWILLDLGLAWYVLRLQDDGALDDPPTPARARALEASQLLRRLRPSGLYSPSTVVLGIVLVAMIRTWSFPVPFAWYDSRYVNFFVLTGVGPEGERHRLDGRVFAPYDILMSQSRFFYATSSPILVDTLGSSYDLETVRELKTADADSIDELRLRRGWNYRDRRATRRFLAFVDRWMTNAQTSTPPLGGFWRHLHPPFHFRSTRPVDVWTLDAPVETVEVELVEYFWTREEVVPVAWQRVTEIDLD